MVLKRKADAIELAENTLSTPLNTTDTEPKAPLKKARVAKTPAATDAAANKPKPQSWKDIKLPGEDEDGGVPVYDDCGDIRRKIKQLLTTPNFKVTHWLDEIGINNNSYGRFMRMTGKHDGAGNGTFYAAYVYFEKVRVLEGKKKTAKRIKCENEMPGGHSLETQRRGVWIFGK